MKLKAKAAIEEEEEKEKQKRVKAMKNNEDIKVINEDNRKLKEKEIQREK